MSKNSFRWTALLCFAFMLFIVSAAPASSGRELTPTPTPAPTISEVRISNIRDVSFTVSWVTDQSVSGEVRYGTDANNLNQTAHDARGAGTSDDTHLVTLSGLSASTTYYFDVVSNGTVDNNGGAHYSVTTAGTLGVPSSDTVYGELFKSDGSTKAEGSIVHVTIIDNDGVGSSGESVPLSALVDSSGFWATNLGNARVADLSGYFSYGNGDLLRLEALGAADGNRCVTLAFSMQVPAQTLADSSCASISDMRISNVRDVSFTVSWLSEQETTSEIRYGTNANNLDQSAQAAGSDDTHHVTVSGLQASTTYYFDVLSGATTDSNNGAHYTMTTGTTLGVPGSDTSFGQVFKSDGTTPANGTIVYVTLEDANGVGTSGQSARLSTVVDQGFWAANLGNARTSDLNSYFSYSDGDLLHLEAYGASDGIACVTVEIGSAIPNMVMSDSCTVTIDINLQGGWNFIALPIEPLVAYTAESACDEINQQGGSVVEIDRWHNGGWAGHICDLPFNDFDLELGSGFFLRTTAASTWTIEGYPITQPASLNLQMGWNTIALPSNGYTAESLCDEITDQGVTPTEIDRWHNGGWDGHICDRPFNDFAIDAGSSYFVKTTSSGSVTIP